MELIAIDRRASLRACGLTVCACSRRVLAPLLFREESELLSRAGGVDDALLEEELTKTRLVPCVESI